MTDRSSRAEVRNPVVGCPEAMAALAACPPEAVEALRAVLHALAGDWTTRANGLWRRHKAPMAAYWKINAVNARHIARAIRSISRQEELGL
jgi:hypothetical protein